MPKKKLTKEEKVKILVVDDKPSFLQTLTRMLNSLGYTNVRKAADGEAALELLSLDSSYDLILCDWNMPLISGLEVLKHIRESTQLSDIPFVMVTAEVDSFRVAEAGEIDLDGYLLKPFTLNDLEKKIAEVLKKRQAPTDIDVHINSSLDRFNKKEYDLALEDLKKALKLNKKSPRVHYAMGRIHESMENIEQAKKSYKRAADIAPQFLKAHTALVKLHQASGDIAAAAVHLDRAVAISPGDMERQMQLGQALIQTGQKAKAKAVLTNVMKISDTKNADVARQVGETFMDAGLYAEAQSAFKKGMALDPKDIYMYNRMGIALRRQKKFTEAINNYQLALGINPKDENIYYNLGRAYLEAGQKKNSIIAMKRALQINSRFEEAREFLDKIGSEDESDEIAS